MKKVSSLKLSQLNKNSMSYGQQSRLMAGNYCAWGDENQAANDTQGKCSCWCEMWDYYDSNVGLKTRAHLWYYVD